MNEKRFHKENDLLISNTWYLIDPKKAESVLYYEGDIHNCIGIWNGLALLPWSINGLYRREATKEEVIQMYKKYAPDKLDFVNETFQNNKISQEDYNMVCDIIRELGYGRTKSEIPKKEEKTNSKENSLLNVEKKVVDNIFNRLLPATEIEYKKIKFL